MRVLYISNIEVPYRSEFFNQLAKACDLTVLYERKKSSSRNQTWATSQSRSYRTEYLRGIPIGGESSFSLGIFCWIFRKHDAVIIGCFNSPIQALAILVMRLLGMAYYVNVDGEVFLSGNGLKARLKRFVLSRAKGYLVAGEKAAENMEKALGLTVHPYHFSSLTQKELEENAATSANRDDTVLVVGQYFPCKGMDIALSAAKLDPSIPYKFVGMGKRTELFLKEQMPEKLSNVEVISFLQKEDLKKAYQSCGMLVLPSRQECWGLVINEAASFGTPIVSTWGSGAAVEFLSDSYPQFLAKPGDPEDLHRAICVLREMPQEEKTIYSEYLIEKSKMYSIEENIAAIIKALGK